MTCSSFKYFFLHYFAKMISFCFVLKLDCLSAFFDLYKVHFVYLQLNFKHKDEHLFFEKYSNFDVFDKHVVAAK